MGRGRAGARPLQQMQPLSFYGVRHARRRKTGHRPPRRGERDHQAIAHGLDFVATVLGDLLAHQLLVGPQDLARGVIAETHRQVSRPDDIGEEDGDSTFGQLRRQNTPCLWQAGGGTVGGWQSVR